MRGPLPLAQNAPLKLLDASVEKGLPRGNPRAPKPIRDQPVSQSSLPRTGDEGGRPLENTGLEPVTSCLQSRRSPD